MTTKTYDIALGPDPENPEELIAHRPDCPLVRGQAAAGAFVTTLLGCEGELPKDLKVHSCLGEADA